MRRKFTVWRTPATKYTKVRTLYPRFSNIGFISPKKTNMKYLKVEIRGNFNELGNQSFMYPSDIYTKSLVSNSILLLDL